MPASTVPTRPPLKPKRKYLFIHQNFPGQFVHVATELVRQGHEVVALGIQGRAMPGVKFLRYAPKAPARTSEVEAAIDFETKVVRGTACAQVMAKLKADGFTPDTIVAHPGWGESLFCKDVWPQVRLVIFAEFFYGTEGTDYHFDPEFTADTVAGRMRLRIKNSVHLHALHSADVVYAPTHWQANQIPAEYRGKVKVIFDGIDSTVVKPNPKASIHLQREDFKLDVHSEVITFVNRNLEPYRGFHIFMRALPEILKVRPRAHVLIIGRDEVSYGAPPKVGGTWREVMLAEVGAQLPMARVHFLGGLPYEDYLRVMQISTCHVYLTYPFVLSWSCVEAMSAGRVVVASNTGPVTEVIEHGKNGLLFDFFDVAALSKQVIEVLAQPKTFSGLGHDARQTVISRFDLKTRCLPELLKLIDTGD